MQIDWGVIAQIMAILGGFAGFLLWIMKLVIQKMLIDFRDTTVDDVADGIKAWAVENFPSKVSFERHVGIDLANHGELTRALTGLVHDRDSDHTRLRKLEEEVTKIKFEMEGK